MNILITGSASGLGKAIADALAQGFRCHNVKDFDIVFGQDVRAANEYLGVDDIDVLINCAGVNDIDWLENFDEGRWDRVMDINAKGIYMMTRACLPALIRSKGTVINIVSNAAHMPMTCSLAYNASKGAAHIMTLQLARELTKKHGITVFGIAPNKLSGTGMSADIERMVPATRGWTPEQARAYQLNGLLTGEETPPEAVAEFIAFLLSSKERHKYLSGCIIPYGA